MNRPPLHARWSVRLLLAAVVVAVLWAILGSAGGRKVPSVRVRKEALVQRVVANGRVYVPARIQLGTMVGGIVSTVSVRQGDHVDKDALLLKLDDRETSALVEQARGRLQQLQEVDTRTAEEDLRGAESSYERARRQYERVQALYDSAAVAQQALDEAREEFVLAQSRKDAAAARVASKRRGGSEQRQLAAAVAAAEARLANTRLLAPAAGVILSRGVEPGDVVQAGGVLFTMARDTTTILSVQPEEKNLAFLHLGQEAQASADAWPGRVFSARIIEIAPAVDPQRGTIEIKLLAENPPPFLKADMTVSVNIETARKDATLVLPLAALRDPDSARPWVLAARDGRAVRIDVQTGIRGEGTVEIVDGLADGEAVLIPSAEAVAEGARVQPKIVED